jgi:hypothetical protein
MRTSVRLWLASAGIALGLLAAGCGGEREQATPVQQFIALATAGVSADFTPLTSPRDAVTRADLIVEGTLVEIGEGIALRYPDPAKTQRRANSYMTFVIAVDRVLAGDPTMVHNGRVYLTVRKSGAIDVRDIAAANPQARMVAALDDVTSWTPSPDAQVVRPKAVPPGAPLYAPYNDGMWLEGAGDAAARGYGHTDDHHGEQAGATWSRSRRLADITTLLRTAAGPR